MTKHIAIKKVVMIGALMIGMIPQANAGSLYNWFKPSSAPTTADHDYFRPFMPFIFLSIGALFLWDRAHARKTKRDDTKQQGRRKLNEKIEEAVAEEERLKKIKAFGATPEGKKKRARIEQTWERYGLPGEAPVDTEEAEARIHRFRNSGPSVGLGLTPLGILSSWRNHGII